MREIYIFHARKLKSNVDFTQISLKFTDFANILTHVDFTKHFAKYMVGANARGGGRARFAANSPLLAPAFFFSLLLPQR